MTDYKLLSAPKNSDTKNIVLALISGVAAGLLFAAFAGVRLYNFDLPFGVVGFGIFAGTTYGAGFFFAPNILIDMNFNAVRDINHEFLARFAGANMLIINYALYAGWIADEHKFVSLYMGIIALVGPTQAALWLDCKQTPDGHMPAHILFMIAALLALNGPK